MKDQITPVSIFIPIPGINDYVEVNGAKMEVIDGKQYLRISCLTTDGKEVLLNPSDLQVFFNRCAVPF
ncbi:hypothetical protein [Anabaena sp. UHCC 0451]|uniref:hypothetical protein n=1 Tax=Anabaena sp. UHCC 0451 TaxID=2055235 RepID=UPI002B20F0F5|nr:hypothetical protein [Anabaena sp. UHCC 0451]MEA5578637.1 hypothetical protein [Anabaena sp. UHCC 0451]